MSHLLSLTFRSKMSVECVRTLMCNFLVKTSGFCWTFESGVNSSFWMERCIYKQMAWSGELTWCQTGWYLHTNFKRQATDRMMVCYAISPLLDYTADVKEVLGNSNTLHLNVKFATGCKVYPKFPSFDLLFIRLSEGKPHFSIYHKRRQ